jgi:hypothetical protein
MRNPVQRGKHAFRLALFAVLVCLPVSLSAQNAAQPWSTVATAGEADEASQPLVLYGATLATIRPAGGSVTPAAQVILRYTVPPVDGLFFNGCKALRVRFRDDGLGSTVLLYLKRTEISTGATANVLTFASNNFAAAAGFQTQIGPCVNLTFDFNRFSYWIEATMTRSVFGEPPTTGNPGLSIIQITTVIG